MSGFTHRPAVFLAVFFALGICAEDLAGSMPFLLMSVSVLACLLLVSWRWQRGAGMMLAAFVFLCGAFASWDASLLTADHVSSLMEAWHGRDVDVAGRVVSVPEKKSNGLAPKKVFVCALEQVDHRPIQGRALVNFFPDRDVQYGDLIEMTGKFSRPFEFSADTRFSYRAYLARQGIHAVLHVRRAALFRLIETGRTASLEVAALSARVHFQQVFDRHLSAGEAGLMNAMLLGPRDDISPHVYDIFRKTGTAHVIAISGMNMTLTSMGVVFLLGIIRIPRVPRAIAAALIIFFYSCMAGNSAPVARSAMMAVLVILSFVIERETDMFNSLGIAALVLMAMDPGQLHDTGFQLSFLCVGSLMVLAPLILRPFEECGWRDHPVIWFFVESAGVTLAAFIGSAGVMAYQFGFLAPIGLIVNLPVIPLMTLVTFLGGVLLITGIFLPFAAWPFAWCIKVVLNGVVGLLGLAAKASLILCGDLSPWVVIIYYIVLLGGSWFFYCSRERSISPFIDKPIAL